MNTDEEYQAYLDNRVRLRCTNKECAISEGFWTAEKFVNDYINILGCSECQGRIIKSLMVVEKSEE